MPNNKACTVLGIKKEIIKTKNQSKMMERMKFYTKFLTFLARVTWPLKQSKKEQIVSTSIMDCFKMKYGSHSVSEHFKSSDGFV